MQRLSSEIKLGTLPMILAVLLFLALISSSSFASVSSGVATLSITKMNTSEAGYSVFSSIPGAQLLVQGKWNVPTVTCTSSSVLGFEIFISHVFAEDTGSQLFVTCTGTTAAVLSIAT